MKATSAASVDQSLVSKSIHCIVIRDSAYGVPMVWPHGAEADNLKSVAI